MQTTSAVLVGDNLTTSTTPVDLLSTTLTTTGGSLDITATISAAATAAGGVMQFTLVVDGVAIAGASIRTSSAGVAESCAIQGRRSPASGSHTIKLQWCIPAGGTANIRVSTNPNTEHAYLRIYEVNG